MWSRNSLRYRTQRLVSVFTRARRLFLSLARLIQYTSSYLNKCIFIQWQKNLVTFYSLNYRASHQNPFITYTSVPDRSLTSCVHVGMFVILTNFYYVCPLTIIIFLTSLILLLRYIRLFILQWFLCVCVRACVCFFQTLQPVNQFSRNLEWTWYHWKPLQLRRTCETVT